MTRRPASAALVVLILSLVIAGCSGSSSNSAAPTSNTSTGTGSTATSKDDSPAHDIVACTSSPSTCNSGAVTGKRTGTFTYTIEKDISNWNLLTSAGSTFDTQEALDSVYPNAFQPSPDLTYQLMTDYFTSAAVTSTTPQTVVYTFNPKAVWSDGVPMTADDLILTWRLQSTAACGGPTSSAASAPTYCDPATTSGYDNIKSITSSDNGRTATVVFSTPYTDWKSLFGPILPFHIAKANGGTETKAELSAATAYFSKTVPTWSGGPYIVSKFQPNTAVTEVPNPRWFGAAGPGFATLVFRIITDSTQEVPALKNGEVNAIYPQPEVDLVSSVKSLHGVTYHIGAGLVWEHFDFNLHNKALQDKTVRLAMFTALDRAALIKRTVGQFDPGVKTVDNHMFVPGQDGYVNNTPSGLGTGDVAAATSLLTGAGYKIRDGKLIEPDGTPFPVLTARYAVGNGIRQDELAEFARNVKKIGITMNVMSTDNLGATLTHAGGKDYDVVVFAWTATPAVYQGAEQLWLGASGSNFGGYHNPAVDALLNKAVAETSTTVAAADVNAADKLLSADAYVMPLYQKPTFLAYTNGTVNIRDNATSVGPPYNVAEWGFGTPTAK